MNDEKTDSRRADSQPRATGERDALASLISAAGRRPDPPPGAYDEVFAAAHEAWQRKLRARARRYRAHGLAATIATLAVGAGLIVQLVPREAAPSVATAQIVRGEVLAQLPGADAWQPLDSMTSSIVAGTRLRTMVDAGVALTLDDDGSLRLDAESSVTITAARQIDLTTGAIYLDAGAEASTEPYLVTTRFATVRDIGTQFEVATVNDSLRVRVREGAVELTAPTAVAPLRGSAGEQISLGVNGNAERSQFSPFDPEWSWAEILADSPEIEGQSLMLFLSWVARETGRELRFDAPVTETRARTVILHGSAENLAPLEALDVMLATTDFDYTLGDDGVILISPRASSP